MKEKGFNLSSGGHLLKADQELAKRNSSLHNVVLSARISEMESAKIWLSIVILFDFAHIFTPVSICCLFSALYDPFITAS